MLKKFVKMLGLVKKSAYVICEWPLSERLMQLREAQKFSDQLQEKVESVENNLNKKENLLSDMSFNSKELADRCEKLSEETSCLQNVIAGLNTECDRQREQITALHSGLN